MAYRFTTCSAGCKVGKGWRRAILEEMVLTHGIQEADKERGGNYNLLGHVLIHLHLTNGPNSTSAPDSSVGSATDEYNTFLKAPSPHVRILSYI